MNFRQPAIYIIIIVSIILAFGWSYFKKSKEEKPASVSTPVASEQQTDTAESISNLSNADPTDFDSITKKTYGEAEKKALETDSENKIAAIEIKIDENLSPDTVVTRYIFNSSSDSGNNWVITFSNSGSEYVRALIPVSDYMGTLTQMNTKAWRYNSVTALQLAEKNGGLTWRENQKLTGVKLTLKHAGKKNWLLWIVEYQGASENLTIQLDANSGRVIEE
jgi:hypothetical protein